MEDICTTNVIHEEIVTLVKSRMIGDYTGLSLLFKAVCDETRLKILDALSIHTLCVCDLAALLGMSSSAVSHQLRILRQAELVRCDRQGKSAYYALADNHVNILMANAAEHVGEKSGGQKRGDTHDDI
jgi:ArsR family transcriptional regulator